MGLFGNAFAKKAVKDAIKTAKTGGKIRVDAEDLTDSDIEKILDAMAKSDNPVVSLNIACNDFTDEVCTNVAEYLTTDENLKELSMGTNDNITDKGIIPIVEAIKTHTALTTFNCSLTRFGDEGLEAMIEMLETNGTLETLWINNAEWSEQTLLKFIPLLEERNCTLKNVVCTNSYNGSLDKNSKSVKRITLLAKSQRTAEVEVVSSSESSSAEEGTRSGKLNIVSYNVANEVKKVEESRAKNMVVEDDPYINAEGWQAIAEAVAKADNPIIEQLTINRCDNITAAGEPIAQILESGQVQSLKLAGLKDLGDEGAAPIIEALKTNTKLISLEIVGCGLTDVSGLAFAEALKENKMLCSLNLSSGGFTDETGNAIKDALSENVILGELVMSFCKISEELRGEIDALVQSDRSA